LKLKFSYSNHGTRVIIHQVWTRGTWETKVSGKWVFHSSGVKSIAWAPSSAFVASGSYDQSIFLWNLNKPMKKQVGLRIVIPLLVFQRCPP